MRWQDWRGVWRDVPDDPPEGCPGCAHHGDHGPRCPYADPPRVIEIEGDRGDTLARHRDTFGRPWMEDETVGGARERAFVIGDDAGEEG